MGKMQNNVSTVTGGYSDARNFKGEFEGEPCFLRVFPVNQSLEARRREIRCCETASEYGIAPRVLHVDGAVSQLTTAFIAGESPTFADYHDEDFLQLLFSKLRGLHSINCLGMPTTHTPGEYVAVKQLPDLYAHLKSIMRDMQAISDRLTDQTCLIHNDLNPKNILKCDDTLYFVDWTDAGVGVLYQDVAEIMVFHEVRAHEKLLTLYFSGEPSHDQRTLSHLHWQMRLGVFSVWGYCEAARLLPTEDLDKLIKKISKALAGQDYLQLLKELVNGEKSLSTPDDFIHFSLLMLQQLEATVKS